MKLWGLFMACVTVASLTCKEESVKVDKITTRQQADQVLRGINGFELFMIKNTLSDKFLEKVKKISDIGDKLNIIQAKESLTADSILSLIDIQEVELFNIIELFKKDKEEQRILSDWSKAKRNELEKKNPSQNKYIPHAASIKENGERENFKKTIQLQEKLEGTKMIPKVVACKIWDNRALAIVAKKPEVEFYDYQLVEMGGRDRLKLYKIAAEMLSHVHKVGGLVKVINSDSVVLDRSNLDATQFDIYNQFYLQSSHLKEIKNDLAIDGVFTDDPDFARFQAKHTLQTFIKKSETTRQKTIEEMKLQKEYKSEKKIAKLKENSEPLPSAFNDLVQSMSDKSKGLHEILAEMKQMLKRRSSTSSVNGRKGSPSTSVKRRSSSSSGSRKSRRRSSSSSN